MWSDIAISAIATNPGEPIIAPFANGIHSQYALSLSFSIHRILAQSAVTLKWLHDAMFEQNVTSKTFLTLKFEKTFKSFLSVKTIQKCKFLQENRQNSSKCYLLDKINKKTLLDGNRDQFLFKRNPILHFYRDIL